MDASHTCDQDEAKIANLKSQFMGTAVNGATEATAVPAVGALISSAAAATDTAPEARSTPSTAAKMDGLLPTPPPIQPHPVIGLPRGPAVPVLNPLPPMPASTASGHGGILPTPPTLTPSQPPAAALPPGLAVGHLPVNPFAPPMMMGRGLVPGLVPGMVPMMPPVVPPTPISVGLPHPTFVAPIEPVTVGPNIGVDKLLNKPDEMVKEMERAEDVDSRLAQMQREEARKERKKEKKRAAKKRGRDGEDLSRYQEDDDDVQEITPVSAHRAATSEQIYQYDAATSHYYQQQQYQQPYQQYYQQQQWDQAQWQPQPQPEPQPPQPPPPLPQPQLPQLPPQLPPPKPPTQQPAYWEGAQPPPAPPPQPAPQPLPVPPPAPAPLNTAPAALVGIPMPPMPEGLSPEDQAELAKEWQELCRSGAT